MLMEWSTTTNGVVVGWIPGTMRRRKRLWWCLTWGCMYVSYGIIKNNKIVNVHWNNSIHQLKTRTSLRLMVCRFKKSMTNTKQHTTINNNMNQQHWESKHLPCFLFFVANGWYTYNNNNKIIIGSKGYLHISSNRWNVTQYRLLFFCPFRSFPDDDRQKNGTFVRKGPLPKKFKAS